MRTVALALLLFVLSCQGTGTTSSTAGQMTSAVQTTSYPQGDSAMTSGERMSIIDAAFEEMGLDPPGYEADSDIGTVPYGVFPYEGELLGITAGPFEFIVATNSLLNPAPEGTFASDAGDFFAFYCRDSWYQLNTGSGSPVPEPLITALRGALDC